MRPLNYIYIFWKATATFFWARTPNCQPGKCPDVEMAFIRYTLINNRTVIIRVVIQSEYAQRGCNLRQIEDRYLWRHIFRYLDLRVSRDVIPKSAYLDARRKALWAKKLSSWSFLPSTSCLMRAYAGSSVFLAVLRVVRYKTHQCLKSLRRPKMRYVFVYLFL